MLYKNVLHPVEKSATAVFSQGEDCIMGQVQGIGCGDSTQHFMCNVHIDYI